MLGKKRKTWRGELRCWSCGTVHDAASEVFEGQVLPGAGDPTMCVDCGEWSVFVGPAHRLTIRKPTEEEFLEIGEMPEARKARMAWVMMDRERKRKAAVPNGTHPVKP